MDEINSHNPMRKVGNYKMRVLLVVKLDGHSSHAVVKVGRWVLSIRWRREYDIPLVHASEKMGVRGKDIVIGRLTYFEPFPE